MSRQTWVQVRRAERDFADATWHGDQDMRSVWRQMTPWVLLLCAWTSMASAQAEDPARARELFYAGRASYDRGAYLEAEENWRESLSLMARASTALNLAQALHDLGRHVEAFETLENLNSGGYGEVPSELRGEAERLEAAIESRIAEADVHSRGSVDVVLWVDGEERGTLSPGETRTIRLDPGPHRIGAAVGSHTEWQSLEAESGLGSSLFFELAPTSPFAPTTEAQPRRRTGLWVVVGIVLASAVVGVAVVVSRRPEPTEDPNRVFPVVSALSWP